MRSVSVFVVARDPMLVHAAVVTIVVAPSSI